MMMIMMMTIMMHGIHLFHGYRLSRHHHHNHQLPWTLNRYYNCHHPPIGVIGNDWNMKNKHDPNLSIKVKWNQKEYGVKKLIHNELHRRRRRRTPPPPPFQIFPFDHLVLLLLLLLLLNQQQILLPRIGTTSTITRTRRNQQLPFKLYRQDHRYFHQQQHHHHSRRHLPVRLQTTRLPTRVSVGILLPIVARITRH